jgi:hypothetical protein
MTVDENLRMAPHRVAAAELPRGAIMRFLFLRPRTSN